MIKNNPAPKPINASSQMSKKVQFQKPTRIEYCCTQNGNWLLFLSFKKSQILQTAAYIDPNHNILLRPIYDVYKEYEFAKSFQDPIKPMPWQQYNTLFRALSLPHKILLCFNPLFLRIIKKQENKHILVVPEFKFFTPITPTKEILTTFIILYNKRKKAQKQRLKNNTAATPSNQSIQPYIRNNGQTASKAIASHHNRDNASINNNDSSLTNNNSNLAKDNSSLAASSITYKSEKRKRIFKPQFIPQNSNLNSPHTPNNTNNPKHNPNHPKHNP
jgi:hypothetical protein